MGSYAEPIAGPGLPITPLQVIRAIAWAGDLQPDDVFWAIRRADEIDLAARWPELPADQIAEMRRLSRAMSRNRLRVWKSSGSDRQATWLEVRALISGLHLIFE